MYSHAGSESASRLSLLEGKGTTKASSSSKPRNVLLIYVASLVHIISTFVSSTYVAQVCIALSLSK